jgi:hypothetical protein
MLPSPNETCTPHAAVAAATAAATARDAARRGPLLPPVLSFSAASSDSALPGNCFYRMGGDSTVTGNVTWLSPAACDP